MSRSAFTVHVGKNRLAAYAFSAFLLGSLWGVFMWNYGGVYTPIVFGSMNRFSSYQELVSFLNTTSKGYIRWPQASGRGFNMPMGTKVFASASEDALFSIDFSGTNIQVEGVDEADVVKTDGEYIYVVQEDSIIIVRAYPAKEAKVLAKLKLNQSVGEIFVNDDKLIVFISSQELFYIMRPGKTPVQRPEPSTNIMIYDIRDRASPRLERSLTVDGYYFNSRMIGDYVYAVTNMPAYLNASEVVLPTIRAGGFVITVKASSIYYANYTDYSYAFTNIVAINVKDPDKPMSHETFLLGTASNLYVSTDNMYITSPRFLDSSDKTFAPFVIPPTGTEGTMVYRIEIKNGQIKYSADGFVPGWVLNQFSMDENDGYFRIATTIGQAWDASKSKSNVYVLNASLGVVGRLEGLAPGEQIYSARFMGKRCYLVTFRKVDPLFVIDLAVPTEPRVLGKLKIPGYSDYLHPYDENHIIGIGKETVDAEEGDFSWYQGVKISLFDVSDVANPKELAKYEIGDRGTDSPVLRDHKAFLFSRSRNLLVIPVLVAEIDPTDYSGSVPSNAYGEYTYQGAYVFRISTEEITLRNRITHLEGAQDLIKSGWYFDSPYSVVRSLYIEDVLYTISGKMIKMNSLENLNEINKLIL